MQEETTQKTIALTIKAAKLDADVLKAALRMYLNRQKQKGNGGKGVLGAWENYRETSGRGGRRRIVY